MGTIMPGVEAVSQQKAAELVAHGARAVVLMGSHVRGDAGPESDIDLYAIGDGPEYRLERRDGFLISTSWLTVDQIEAAFTSPADAAGHVPGWRQAVVLADPDGLAADIIQRAKSWDWDVVGNQRVDTWVAEQLTGYAEEVHKLVSHLERGTLQFAAVERSVLALRIPVIMAVHQRILYDSENHLWDLVAERMGAEWAKNQSAAFGLTRGSLSESCGGSLCLYVMACEAASDLFNRRQRSVVDHACSLARDVDNNLTVNSTIVILIERNTRFLMIYEDRDEHGPGWYFPSGAVEAGESLAATAAREALEETGVTVQATHFLRIDHGYFPESPPVPWWRHIVVAHPCPDVAEVEPEPGITAVEWLSPEELHNLPLRSPDAHDIIAAYLESGPGLPLEGYVFSSDGTLPGFYS